MPVHLQKPSVGLKHFSGCGFRYSFVASNLTTMKRLIKNSNPFILLLLPVVFALVMGISYQSQQKNESRVGSAASHATSLFVKGVSLVKTVCSVAKEKLW